MYLRPTLYAKTIIQILEFYVKGVKSYPHFYISLCPSTRSVLQLTGLGCDVTGRELYALEGGFD